MKTKFAIGCLVQWYEADIIKEYIETLRDAVIEYDGEVKIEIILALNQELEKSSNDQFTKTLPGEFRQMIWDLEAAINGPVHYTWRADLYTIADYRRDFNNSYCEQADVLIWGESDMLVPKQMFTVLDMLHQNAQTPKYIATFGICKMWDDTWKALEHPEFTDKPFIEGDTENWWSLRYNMNKTEMNSFNDKVDELEVTQIAPHKFNGCGLVISSEVIKSGVNIPKSVFFVHEDTAFMLMIRQVLGDIPQYHIKNILLVHNRKHPKKRMFVAGEEGIDKTNTGALRKAHAWYDKANKMCEQNCYNNFNANYKPYTWEDVWK